MSVKRKDIWEIIENQTLWTHVVIPPAEKFLKYLGSFTKTLTVHLEDPDKDFGKISETFLVGIQSICTELDELNIENVQFDAHVIASRGFPKFVVMLGSPILKSLNSDDNIQICFGKNYE